VESLVSILIVALASTVLLTAVATASRLNQSARESQAAYQGALKVAEAPDPTETGESGTVKITGDLSSDISVLIYGKDSEFVRWEYDPVEAP
jgi:hypothetical protein